MGGTDPPKKPDEPAGDSDSESMKEFVKDYIKQIKAEKKKKEQLEKSLQRAADLRELFEAAQKECEELSGSIGPGGASLNHKRNVKPTESGMSSVTHESKLIQDLSAFKFKLDTSWVTGVKNESEFFLWSQTFGVKAKTFLNDLKHVDEEKFNDHFESSLLVAAEKGGFKRMERDVMSELKIGKLRGPEILLKLKNLYNADKNVIAQRNESKLWIKSKISRKRDETLYKALVRLDICVNKCEENGYQPNNEELNDALRRMCHWQNGPL